MRIHEDNRQELETPCKINCPTNPTALSALRLTCGIGTDGKHFSFTDSWKHHNTAHSRLSRPWKGATVFFDHTCADIDACVANMCALHNNPFASNDVPMRPSNQCVRFADSDTVFNVTPYSEIYGTHPHFLLATASGWKRAPQRSDYFTGKSSTVMKRGAAPPENGLAPRVPNRHDSQSLVSRVDD